MGTQGVVGKYENVHAGQPVAQPDSPMIRIGSGGVPHAVGLKEVLAGWAARSSKTVATATSSPYWPGRGR